MHGKVWMFSNLIDDEDIEFMQHEFISYKQAMDYYELGYKPIVRLSHKAGAVYKVVKILFGFEISKYKIRCSVLLNSICTPFL